MTATGHIDAVITEAESVPGDETRTINRPATGAEGSDIWQVQYNGQRGLYANGYGCGRARVPAHADAAEQVALRCQCHSSKNDTAQAIFEATHSDNTVQFQVRANGEYRAPAPRWLDATLGTNITAGTAVAPGTSWEGARVYLRGTIAWENATITGGSTLLTVNEEHRPDTEKTFSVRTGPNSNVATQLHLNPDGTLVNETSFGNGTTADLGLDGLNWDLS